MHNNLDQQGGHVGPGREGERQRRQQHIRDLGVVLREHILQQDLGRGTIQQHVNPISGKIGVGAPLGGIIDRQRRDGVPRQRQPVAQLLLDRGCLGVCQQPASPCFERGRLWRQHDRLAPVKLLVGRIKIFQHDMQRGNIARQMVHDDQQAAGVISAKIEQGDPQERPMR